MKHRIPSAAALSAIALLAVPETATAYVGPGAGLAAIGAALAVVGGILLGILGFFWYPLKRLFKSFAKTSRSTEGRHES